MNKRNAMRVPSNAKNSKANGNETRRPRPWEHPDGTKLSDSELRTTSQYWDAETWEDYLSLFEKKQREYLASNYAQILYTSDLKLSLESYLYGSDENFVTRELVTTHQLRAALLNLTERQRQVIRAIFYDGLTQADVARMLKVSPKRVSYLVRHTIKLLRHQLAARLTPRK